MGVLGSRWATAGIRPLLAWNRHVCEHMTERIAAASTAVSAEGDLDFPLRAGSPQRSQVDPVLP
jgi:hypothetical protein